MAVRRWLALRQRPLCEAVWPAKPGTETAPAGWPGWPDGKQFAVVLTHDVEGRLGLGRCRQLMELERQLGFRSSFNFIPEGSYSVPDDLRDQLHRNGFEVAVHDLRHDGRLYNSRRDFSVNAGRINRYLKEWDAVGFRSGFMHHNLDWLHDLNIQYDASTFDTDPFEPQPDGVDTIFPFWVPRLAASQARQARRTSAAGVPAQDPLAAQAGYVELPYTLPQDSTLFLVLRETSPDIWLRKLDWVAAHGGMVLVNVHPDFISFDPRPARNRETSPAPYRALLEHLRRRWQGAFWHALPREVARFVAEFQPRNPRLRGKRVAMVTHSFYESDNRVIRYAEALARRGDSVDVLALRRTDRQLQKETLMGVTVYRLQERAAKNEQTKVAYLLPLLRFLGASSLWLARRHVREPYDLIHVHNVPDFLVFSAWLPRRLGAKVILDIHDIVPEFYISKFHAAPASSTVRLLQWVERASARVADHVIISNHLWLEKYVARAAPPKKCSVFLNHVDTHIFHPRERRRADGKLIILFPGGLQRHQGLDVAIRAFARLAPRLPQAEFHLYGDGQMKPELTALARDLGLDQKVRFFNPLPVREIAAVMAQADLGVVPKRADSFGNEAYSTKIMEFLSLGVPVVVADTKIDRYYFDDTVVQFFASGDDHAMASAMFAVLENQPLRQSFAAQATPYVARNCWETRQGDYLRLVDELCAAPRLGEARCCPA